MSKNFALDAVLVNFRRFEYLHVFISTKFQRDEQATFEKAVLTNLKIFEIKYSEFKGLE